MSHNDTIELCGLPGDVREVNKRKGSEGKKLASNTSLHMEEPEEEAEPKENSKSMDFSIIDGAINIATHFDSSKLMVTKKTVTLWYRVKRIE